MDNHVDPRREATPAPIMVREHRQIMMWPMQLAPGPDSSHCERLRDLDPRWQEVADEFTENACDFQERHYAEFVAFMPDVQRFLYGEERTRLGTAEYEASPIRVFRRRDVARARIILGPGDTPIEMDVARIELYFFYDIDLAILAVEVVGRDLTLEQAEDTLFRLPRAYPTSWNTDGTAAHCCAGITLLGEDGRILAVSDYEKRDRYLAFVCEHRVPRIAAHWEFLLAPLAIRQEEGVETILCQPLEHQRMPLLACLAVDDPSRIGRDDWIRLGLASPSGPAGSLPFARDFLADFETRHCYDRFWDADGGCQQTATRILCSRRAFVMVGEAGSPAFTDMETGIIAQFRHQYFLLGLIAHFHRAALLIFRDRLVTAISQLHDYSIEAVKHFKREIRQTHENFLRFTHRYWFQEVSNQTPARDLFNLWVAQLGSDRLFAEVREEVQDMVSYLDSDGLRRQASTVVRLTVVTFFGLIGTVATGFLGMNLIDLTQVPLLHKAAYLVAVLVPVAALTFYTAAKSQRLAEFLEAVSDQRRSTRRKLEAFVQVWRRPH